MESSNSFRWQWRIEAWERTLDELGLLDARFAIERNCFKIDLSRFMKPLAYT